MQKPNLHMPATARRDECAGCALRRAGLPTLRTAMHLPAWVQVGMGRDVQARIVSALAGVRKGEAGLRNVVGLHAKVAGNGWRLRADKSCATHVSASSLCQCPFVRPASLSTSVLDPYAEARPPAMTHTPAPPGRVGQSATRYYPSVTRRQQHSPTWYATHRFASQRWGWMGRRGDTVPDRNVGPEQARPARSSTCVWG